MHPPGGARRPFNQLPQKVMGFVISVDSFCTHLGTPMPIFADSLRGLRLRILASYLSRPDGKPPFVCRTLFRYNHKTMSNNCLPSEGYDSHSESAALRSFGDRLAITELVSRRLIDSAYADPRPDVPSFRTHAAPALLLYIASPPAYIRSKTNSTPSPLSCVKLIRMDHPDGVLASFELTYHHDFNAVAYSSVNRKGPS